MTSQFMKRVRARGCSRTALVRMLGFSVAMIVVVSGCGPARADSTTATTVLATDEPSESALIAAAEDRATAMLSVDGRGMWETLTKKCQSSSTPGQVTDYLGFRRLQLRDQTGVDLDEVAVEVSEATVDGAIGRVSINYSTGDQAADDVLAAEDRSASPWVWDGDSWRHPDCAFRG